MFDKCHCRAHLLLIACGKAQNEIEVKDAVQLSTRRSNAFLRTKFEFWRRVETIAHA